MSNVVQFAVAPRARSREACIPALLGAFAQSRRPIDDVFWLKENAELLNLLAVTGREVAPEALEPLAGFYENAADRLAFFPQYYRFILSIALDMETLGWRGRVAEELCAMAARSGLAQAELSDLQRAEARRLLSQRRFADDVDAGLDDRLRAFVRRPETFAIPNKKAAYELTHIAFYLSDYGTRDPNLDAGAIDSLHFAGAVAYLEGNSDLLAEVSIALRYSGVACPQPWVEFLTVSRHEFHISEGQGRFAQDSYHDYLVCQWEAALSGQALFDSAMPHVPNRFEKRRSGAVSPLREISEVLFLMDANARGMKASRHRRLTETLSFHAKDRLEKLEAALPTRFGRFFDLFARGEAAGASVEVFA